MEEDGEGGEIGKGGGGIFTKEELNIKMKGNTRQEEEEEEGDKKQKQ